MSTIRKSIEFYDLEKEINSMGNYTNQSKLPNKPSLWQAVMSVLASFIGIQSKKNFDRDAESDRNIPIFIVVGFVLAILLHLIIFLVVKIILWRSGLG